MEIFKNRPLTLACFLFIITLWQSFYLLKGIKFVLMILFLVLAVVMLVLSRFIKKHKNGAIAFILSFLFIFLALFSSYRYFDMGHDRLQKYADTTGTVTAMVTKISYREDFVSYLEVKALEINGKKENTKIKLECEYLFPYDVGDVFKAEVEFAELKDNANGYPEKMIGISKGLSLAAFSKSVDDITLIEKDRFDVMIFAARLNGYLDDILRLQIGEERSGISRAILLGNQSALSLSEERDIRHVGVSHLLALSGMHLTILIGSIGYLFTLIGIPKKLRFLFLSFLTVGYVVLTGMQLSMVRSAIMLFVAYLAFIVGRERDMLTSLFLSVILICLFAPNAFFDVGLELSFLCMVGIVVFGDAINEFFKKLFENIRSKRVRKILGGVCVSIAITFVASVSVLPAIWFYFGETSLVSITANLALSPFADLILMISPLVIIFSKVPFLGEFIAWATGTLSSAMLELCSIFAKNRSVMVSLRYPFAGYIIIAVAIILTVMLVVRIRKRILFFIPIASGITAFLICLFTYTNMHAGELNVSYVSDKSNEGLVAVSEGRALVCDISSGSKTFALKLVYELDNFAVWDIDTYMLTHYHDVNPQSFDRVSDMMYVRNLWLPLPQNEDDILIAESLFEIAKKKGIDVFVYDSDVSNELSFESIEIDIMPTTYINRSSHPVSVLSFENENAKITYIGAAAHESVIYEDALSVGTDCEVLIFGCHGAKTKTPFSYGKLSENLESVVFGNSEVLGYIDIYDPEFLSSVRNADIKVAPKRVNFVFD